MISSSRPQAPAAVRLLRAALLCLVPMSTVVAQSSNVRAQAHFYSAKEAYLARQYERALDYVYKSKEALKGTNSQLQHLHVLAAYHAQDFVEAQQEIGTFFGIIEKTVTEAQFDRSVEQLTRDEVTEVTKLINKIDEGVVAAAAAERTAKRAADAQRAATEARRLAVQAFAGSWSGRYGGPVPTKHWLTLQATSDNRLVGVFRYESPRMGGVFEEDVVGTLASDGTLHLRGTAHRVVEGRLRVRYYRHTMRLRIAPYARSEELVGIKTTADWPDDAGIGFSRQ
jgi:hypothetical protein